MHRDWNSACCWLVAMSIAGAVPGPAAGESPVRGEDSQATAAAERVIRDEIVVTARHRQERLLDVPMAITTFDRQAIEDGGIESTLDLVARVPNMSLAETFTVGTSFVTVRGMHQINNGDSPIAVVVDGVYQAESKQFRRRLFDIERIEVLKGPQGAIYGRGAVGGVVRVLTRRPEGQGLTGSLRIGSGDADRRAADASLDLPLVGGALAIRLAGSFEADDGRIENVFLGEAVDDHDDRFGRLRAIWQLAERSALDLVVARSDSEGGAATYNSFPTTGFNNDFSVRPIANIRGTSERQIDEISLRWSWQRPGFDLTATTALADLDETYRGDGDFTNRGQLPFLQLGQGQDLTMRSRSHEVRIVSPDDQRWRWSGGAFLQTIDRDLTSHLFIDLDGTIDGFLPFMQIRGEEDRRAWATYAQLDVAASSRWQVAVACRYDEDRRELLDPTTGSRRDETFDAVQPRLTVQARPTERSRLYLAVGEGFRSGGFNAPTVVPEIFDRETTRNFELGGRGSTLGGRLTWSTAIYRHRVRDLQYFFVDLARGGQVVETVERAEMRGVELDLRFSPRAGRSLYVAAGWNDSEILDFDGTGRFVGLQTPGNLRRKVVVGGRISHPISDRWLAIADVDLEARGRQFWHLDNLDVQEPVELLGARLTLESDRWSVSVWGRNLTDEGYYVEYADARWLSVLSGQDIAQLGPLRSVGVDLRYRF